MSTHHPSIRIGIYGAAHGTTAPGRPWGLWLPGYPAALTAAGAEPVPLENLNPARPWEEFLEGLDGLVFAGSDGATVNEPAREEGLLGWCRSRRLPLLAIDEGMLTLNTAFGGSCYLDLARELPEALQHRHPPEHGVRHAITVARGTHLAQLYGEGEIVVNSEHRRGLCRLARGFMVSARALDGVIEGIEAEGDDWFAVGVQWQPASATASGLDIQLFRGLVDFCGHRQLKRRGGNRATTPRRRPTRQLVSA